MAADPSLPGRGSESLRIGLFGGSFNPPHVGHVLSVTYALSVFELDRVVVVPVYRHALGKTLLGFEQRLELCRLAFQGCQGVEVSSVEATLPVPSRTLATVEALERAQPACELHLIVGSDILSEVSQWHAFDEIQRRAPLCVLPRTGAGAGVSILPAVSSTQVRGWLRARAMSQQPASQDERLSQVVPRSVLSRVLREGWYA